MLHECRTNFCLFFFLVFLLYIDFRDIGRNFLEFSFKEWCVCVGGGNVEEVPCCVYAPGGYARCRKFPREIINLFVKIRFTFIYLFIFSGWGLGVEGLEG